MHVNLKQFDKTIDFDIFDEGFERYVSKCRPTLYEPEVMDAMMRFARTGDIVIDGGADVGYFTMLLSRMVGDDGQVLAFEPNAKSREVIAANLAANGIGNVLVSGHALWSEQGEQTFHVLEVGSYSSFVPYAGSTPQTVSTMDIDTITDGSRVSLIKLDCEGAEEIILHGAESTLRRGVDAVIVEMNWSVIDLFGGGERSMRDYMNSLGYDFFLLGAPLPIYVPPTVRLDAKDQCINVLFSTINKVAQAWPTATINFRKLSELPP